jgi:hypothetical protein
LPVCHFINFKYARPLGRLSKLIRKPFLTLIGAKGLRRHACLIFIAFSGRCASSDTGEGSRGLLLKRKLQYLGL